MMANRLDNITAFDNRIGKNVDVYLQLDRERYASKDTGTRKEAVNRDNKSQNGDRLHVQYTVTLKSDGKEFETTRAHNRPFIFIIGAGIVCKEWDKELLNTSVDEQRHFEIEQPALHGACGGARSDAFIYDIERIKIERENDEL